MVRELVDEAVYKQEFRDAIYEIPWTFRSKATRMAKDAATKAAYK
jgi:hypothetical protein